MLSNCLFRCLTMLSYSLFGPKIYLSEIQAQIAIIHTSRFQNFKHIVLISTTAQGDASWSGAWPTWISRCLEQWRNNIEAEWSLQNRIIIHEQLARRKSFALAFCLRVMWDATMMGIPFSSFVWVVTKATACCITVSLGAHIVRDALRLAWGHPLGTSWCHQHSCCKVSLIQFYVCWSH